MEATIELVVMVIMVVSLLGEIAVRRIKRQSWSPGKQAAFVTIAAVACATFAAAAAFSYVAANYLLAIAITIAALCLIGVLVKDVARQVDEVITVGYRDSLRAQK